MFFIVLWQVWTAISAVPTAWRSYVTHYLSRDIIPILSDTIVFVSCRDWQSLFELWLQIRIHRL